MRSCYQSVAQTRESLPITNDNIAASMEAMHYPYLVSTTCVSAGMIAMGAVVGDWPGGSALPQPCQHVLDGLPDPLVRYVSRGLACGSHAAAPAALMIRRVAHRSPS